SYSEGIPDTIKNAVLAVYHRSAEATRNIFDLLSVAPNGCELTYLETIAPGYSTAIASSVEKKILLVEAGKIAFKHELYRRTIEASLSPLKRMALNKSILTLLLARMDPEEQVERIIHHARHANAYAVIAQYAPIAAQQAAGVGAHIEASKLYLTAIEHYHGEDTALLTSLFEGYAYECYLSNQVSAAIAYTCKALKVWQAQANNEKTGNALRFLSRLWWLDGNRRKAEEFAQQAIEVLHAAPASSATSMAFSNMSQLKMLTGDAAGCISWGQQAIAIAAALNDEEIRCHALNNLGSVQMRIQSSSQKGIALLQESLSIALQNGYEEHVARAYNNLGINGVAIKEYTIAQKAFEEGIQYSKDKDLDSFTNYMFSWNAKRLLEQGHWEEAYRAAEDIVSKGFQLPAASICAMDVLATIKMRRGDADALALLQQAKTKAFQAKDLQGIISSVISLLEYEWITGTQVLDKEAYQQSVAMVMQLHDFFDYNDFTFWLGRARNHHLTLRPLHPAYQLQGANAATNAARLWQQWGCPYEEALSIFETNEAGQRKAINLLQQLGAVAVCEKLKLRMRSAGIRKIPRGRRKTTLSNTAMLTSREMDLLPLMKEGLQNKEIASRLYISAKTVDHHISSILFKLDVNTRNKAVTEALRQQIIS
ncbi:MAG TPA: LuxR C-terminal-related transcriptional regulator, partial [Chitinophagaceae bacterium]|nr:LuxR C-terminal-related transcriptional regulator [Chitinophagaceae bacterium]